MATTPGFMCSFKIDRQKNQVKQREQMSLDPAPDDDAWASSVLECARLARQDPD